MKKSMKKIALMLICVLVAGVLGGCNKFDASAYVKALLDNSYLNDASGYLETKIGTEEEAAAIYEEGIDAEINAMLGGIAISEELEADYRQVFGDMFSKVKYTVGEAEEVDSSTYVVTITYEQMNVFETAMTAYATASEAMIAEWATAETMPTDAEMYEQTYALLRDCLNDAIATATYDEAATTTIRVELINNVWTPNADDFANLETVLFDVM